MKNNDVTKLELAIDNTRLNGCTPEQVRCYIYEEVVPALSMHILNKERGGNVSVSGSVSSDGTATVSGSVSISW